MNEPRLAFLRRMDNDVRKLRKAHQIDDLIESLVPSNPDGRVVLRVPDQVLARIRRLHWAATRLRTGNPRWKPEFDGPWTVLWYGTMLIPESCL